MLFRGVVVATLCRIACAQTFSATESCFFGSGFDLVQGCNKASALASPPLPCKNDSDPGPCIWSAIETSETSYTRKVETYEEFNDMTSLAVTAEGGGFGVHVSASTNYMSSSQTSERSVSYFLGQAGSVRSDSIRGISDMKVAPEALELLQQCESITNCSFIERYGIHYIDQITYGRSFLGSFTMWDRSSSKSSSLDVMASFSANEIFFSASASMDFQKSHSQEQTNLQTLANAAWLGGTGIVINGSSPAGLYQSFLQWNETSFDNPAKMTMTFRNWIDLPDIQRILNSKSDEVRSLFSPKQIVTSVTNMITKEWAKTTYVLSAINHALAWPCSQQQEAFKNGLSALYETLTTHLIQIESASEVDVLEVQAQILFGNYSFFIADGRLTNYSQLVEKYFPNGACGVCEEEYKCGKTACCDTSDRPVCCPARPGVQEQDLCLRPGGTCCTDSVQCYGGFQCRTSVSGSSENFTAGCCPANMTLCAYNVTDRCCAGMLIPRVCATYLPQYSILLSA
jgi:hypothetical protein